MIVTHSIEMDLCRPGRTPRVEAVQDDKYSRNLKIALYEDGVPWNPGRGVMAIVSYVKPDGTGGSYNFLPDGTRAWLIEDNVVTVALAPQVCTAAGRVKLAVNLTRDAVRLSTFTIEVEVRSAPGLRITSEDYYRISGTLPDSGWLPDMLLGTDEEGTVVVVKPVAVDDTLTVSGGAADAKTVGDRLGDLAALETADKSSLVAAVNETAEMAEGSVKSINGVGPDEAGNISMTISAMPLPTGTAQVGQFLRVKAVDDNGKVLAVDTAEIDTAETEEAAQWYNLESLSGYYYSPEMTAFAAGEFPLSREYTETIAADSDDLCVVSLTSLNGITAAAGDRLELEVSFPAVELEGVDYSVLYFDYVLYDSTLSYPYSILYNASTGELTGDTDSVRFESCTLTEKRDDDGNITGFSLTGILAHEFSALRMTFRTDAFTNEKPFTYTTRVDYGSYDAVRYRINGPEETTEEDTGSVVINLCDYGINLWELLDSGAGAYKTSITGNDFLDALPGPGEAVILTNDDGINYPITINNVVTGYRQDGTPIQAAFSFTAAPDITMLVSIHVAIVYSTVNGEPGAVIMWLTEIITF